MGAEPIGLTSAQRRQAVVVRVVGRNPSLPAVALRPGVPLLELRQPPALDRRRRQVLLLGEGSRARDQPKIVLDLASLEVREQSFAATVLQFPQNRIEVLQIVGMRSG